MPNQNNANHDYMPSSAPPTTVDHLTDQDRAELSELWDAVPFRGTKKATGSSAEGKVLAQRIAAFVASGMSLYELTTALPVGYPSLARLSQAGRDKRVSSHLRRSKTARGEAKTAANPTASAFANSEVADAASTDDVMTATQLLQRLGSDVRALRTRLPDCTVELDLVIELKKT